MNDTEHGAPRERGTIFSVFRYPWLDSPVDPTAATLLLLPRERRCYARVAFVSLLKIISIFVANGAEGGSAARGHLALPLARSLLLLAQMSVRFLVRGARSYFA